MKNNKNVRRDDLSSVDQGSKRIYKMYKSKKNWVVAPVVLATLLANVGVAPLTVLADTTTDQAQTALSSLDTAKKDVSDKISALADLTQAEKTPLQSSLKDAKDEAAAYTVLQDAYKSVVKKAVDAFAKTAEESKNTVSDLKNIDSVTYTAAIDAANTAVGNAQTKFSTNLKASEAGEDNYKDVKKVFDDVVADQTTVVNNQVAAAKEAAAENASLATKKAAAIEKINALTNLSGTRLDYYRAQVNAVTAEDKDFAKTIDEVVAAAQTESLTSAKEEVTTTLTANQTLLGTKYTDLNNKLTAATTLAAVASVKSEVDAAVKAANAAAAQAAFLSKKKEVISSINNESSISAETKKALVDQANAATTDAELTAAKTALADAIKAAADEKKSLVALKEEAQTTVKSLVNIDTLTKGNYERAIKMATTKASVSKLVADAKAADAKVLSDAKEAAVKEINALTSLNSGAKADYTKQVNGITEASKIKAVVDTAKAADKTAALNAVKEEAKQSVNSLKYLSNTSDYTNQIDAAGDEAAVKAIVNEAVQANLKAGLATENLSQAKEVAKQAINLLSDLTPSQVSNALKDVDAAKTVKEVKELVVTANKTNDKNKEANAAAKDLQDAKKAAIKEINTLGSLTADQKTDAISKVNAADTKDKVTKELNEAKTANAAAAAAAAAFAAEKDEANVAISKLANLTSTQKADYMKRVIDAKTIAEVATVLSQANQLNLDQTTDKNQYLEYANTAVDQLTSLNANQRKGYKEELKAAKTIDAMKDIMKAATAQNAKQNDEDLVKVIDKLIASNDLAAAKAAIKGLQVQSNIDTYNAKVDALLQLRAEKEEARKVINDSEYLTPAEKTDYLSKVAAAKDSAAVSKIVDAVKAKAPAEKVVIYRAYNPNDGDHLYTTDKAEFDKVIAAGWNNEGTAWNAASKGTAVYRLYNPNSGEHFYTSTVSEYNDVAAAGWNKEGVAFYSADSKAVNVYRLFNPNAKGPGSHHFTTNASEVSTLVKAGWKNENIAFFGLK